MAKQPSLKTILMNSLATIGQTLFAIAALIQFNVFSITFEIVNYTFGGLEVLIAGTAGLTLILGSSETRDLQYYTAAELALVVGFVALMFGHVYVPTVETFMTANQPFTTYGALGYAVVTGAVLSR